MIDEKKFKEPESVYRTAPFWSLNDALCEDELKRQINEFKAQGMGGAFLHPRGGMATEYLSEDYFKAIGACIDEMKRLGMKAWLYDEDRFPSGTAGGKVLKQDENFSQHYIVLSDTCDCGYEIKKAPESARYDNESYVDVLNKEAIDAFIKLTHDEYCKRFSEHFGDTVPAIFTDEPHFSAAGLPWTNGLEILFEARYGYNLTERIRDLFYDTETSAQTRFHYWDLVSDLFVKNFSKNIYDWCSEKGIAFTGHYWEHVFPSPHQTGTTMPHYEFMQIPGIDMLFVSDENSPNQYGNDLIVKEVSSVANQLGKERVLSETMGGSGWGLDFAYQKRALDWQLALGVNLFCQHLSLYSMTGYRKRDYPLSFLDHQPWWDEYRMLADYTGRMSYALSQGKYEADVLVLHPASSTWINYSPGKGNKQNEDISHSIKGLCRNLNSLRIMYDLGDEIILTRHGKADKGKLFVGDMAYSTVIIPDTYVIRKSVLELLEKFADGGGTVICAGVTPELLEGVHSQVASGFFRRPDIVKIENTAEKISDTFNRVNVKRIRLIEATGKDLSNVYGQIRKHKDEELIFICNLELDRSFELKLELENPYELTLFDGESGEVCKAAVSGNDNDFYYAFNLNALQSVLIKVNKRTIVKTCNEDKTTASKKELEINNWAVGLKDSNAINLHRCRVSLDNGPFGELGDVLEIDDELKDRLGIERGSVNSRQPWMYSEALKNSTHSLAAEYPFNIGQIPVGRLMIAAELPKVFDVFINGALINPMNDFYKDRAFVLYDITGRVKRGENIIRLETKAYGVLINLESVYVVGDFMLKREADGFALYKQGFVSTGNIVEQGFPYYSGKIGYTANVNIDEDFDEAYLNLEKYYGVTAAISINGNKLKTIGWPPYSVDLTGRLIKGKNTISIEISNSLQNLLGPFGKDANQHLVTPNSFYAKKHEVFAPVGFGGAASITIVKREV